MYTAGPIAIATQKYALISQDTDQSVKFTSMLNSIVPETRPQPSKKNSKAMTDATLNSVLAAVSKQETVPAFQARLMNLLRN